MPHEFFRGDDYTFVVPFVRNGAPINLTGAAIRFMARRSDFDADPLITKSVGSGIAITNAAGGLAEVTIAQADTLGFSQAEALVYDIELTEASGRRTTTEKDRMFVKYDVSR